MLKKLALEGTDTGWLANRRSRCQSYVLLGLLCFLLSLAFLSIKGQYQYVLGLDARGYYVYLPSLIIDGDLDFSNQITEHWGNNFDARFVEDRTARGYVRNKYPIGLALTISPAFLTAHGASTALHAWTANPSFAPNGYTILYQMLSAAWIMALGVASIIMIDRLLVDYLRIEPHWVWSAAVLFWIGSPFLYYFAFAPFMIHVVSGFWVNCCLLGVARIVSGPSPPARRFDVFVVVLSAGMAIVCRPTNLFLMPFGICCIVHLLRTEGNSAVSRHLPGLMLGATPALLQMLAWREMSGSLIYFSYGHERFHWTNPVLLATLGSSRHGLFFWSPLLLASVAGLVLSRSGPPLLARYKVCFACAFLILWYVNSCWWCWWFGEAFGGRAFLELAAMFVLGFALLFRELSRCAALARIALTGMAGVALLYHYALMALYILNYIPRDDYLLSF